MIELRNVTFNYRQTTSASKESGLKNISLTIRQGECVLLCGESGCGKTTLARLINGLIPHFYEGELSGEVRVDGKRLPDLPLYETAGVIGTVFQDPRSQFFNVDTASEIAFGPENLGLSEAEITSRVEKVAREMRIEHLLGRSIFKLSGGQKQKIACASVAALCPDIYVLDEPSSNLDMAAMTDLRQHIALWRSQKKTIIVAEHRLHYLRGLCDRVIYMRAGRIEQTFTWEELEALPLQKRTSMGLRVLSLDELKLSPSGTVAPLTDTLEFSDFVYTYKRGEKALDIPSISLPRGAVIAVVGLNGAGKSTFARCLCGLNKHFRGTLTLAGQRLRNGARRRQCFMVMQDVNHQLFTESVLDEVLLGMKKEDKAAAEAILDSMDLLDLEEAHPMSLSGGEKQRVAIATATASAREIIVFDEPTSGLDYTHMRSVASNLARLQEMGKTLFAITHDPELIMACCTHAITIDRGKAQNVLALDGVGRQAILAFFLRKEGERDAVRG
ncbi:MAG: energy-coupling factor ABC transporter ATP-binding protein [Coriobacteriales bacterium]|jgi:energy-coupling factor transport system ATP-binding protein|nr:energy-coupling factor ABC transporter ATP-binding protein [Coriobacteriales bacterium]